MTVDATVTHNPHTRRDQLLYVDGIRGAAALAVATYHTMLFTGHTDDYQSAAPAPLRLILTQGQYGVAAFIVLSGFVLGLPPARNGLHLHGGWRRYLTRRARRILPPYYAALALYVLACVSIPVLQRPHGTAWDSKIPITRDGLLSHLVLLHNLRWEWQGQIDGPMWSVATEWQLYFALPLLLLPLWRKAGLWPVVAVAVTAGALVHALAPSLDGAHFWFLGLFAFGVAAAVGVVRGVRVGWWAAGTVPVLALVAVAQPHLGLPTWALETTVGAAAAVLLVHLAGSRGPARRALEHRALVTAGMFSYSIYLIHSPLLGLGNLLLPAMAWPLRFAVMLTVVLPAAIGCSYVFFLAVERRFLTSHQQKVGA